MKISLLFFSSQILTAFYCTEVILSVVAAPVGHPMGFHPPFPPSHSLPTSPSSPSTSPSESEIFFTDNTSQSVTQEPATSRNMCNFGSHSSSLSTMSALETKSGQLYVDLVQPAPCSGAIKMWNMCFWIDPNISYGAVTFLVMRYDRKRKIYNIVNSNNLDISAEEHSSSALNPICRHFEVEEDIWMEEGDYLGFVCHDFLHIALAYAQGGGNSTLKVYRSQQNFMYMRNMIDPSTLSFQENYFQKFKDGNEELVPLVQVIFSDLAANTTMNTTGRPCSVEIVGAKGLFKSIEFLSVVIAASAIIILLLLVIFCMGCCLCRLDFSEMPHCCQSEQQVTHIVQVEPLFENSMQYNEMYVARKPTESRLQNTKGPSPRIEASPNPAYGHPKSQTLDIGVRDELCNTRTLLRMPCGPCCSGSVTNLTPSAGCGMPETGLVHQDNRVTDLEHTYESVNL